MIGAQKTLGVVCCFFVANLIACTTRSMPACCGCLLSAWPGGRPSGPLRIGPGVKLPPAAQPPSCRSRQAPADQGAVRLMPERLRMMILSLCFIVCSGALRTCGTALLTHPEQVDWQRMVPCDSDMKLPAAQPPPSRSRRATAHQGAVRTVHCLRQRLRLPLVSCCTLIERVAYSRPPCSCIQSTCAYCERWLATWT